MLYADDYITEVQATRIAYENACKKLHISYTRQDNEASIEASGESGHVTVIMRDKYGNPDRNILGINFPADQDHLELLKVAIAVREKLNNWLAGMSETPILWDLPEDWSVLETSKALEEDANVTA